MNALIVVLAGISDRIRGSGKAKLLFKLLLGYCVGLPFGYYADWQSIAFAVGVAAGMTPGWGTAIFVIIRGYISPRKTNEIDNTPDNYEWWQRGVLKDNAVLASIVRGLLVGVPVLPLYFFGCDKIYYVSLVYALAFPVAAMVGYIVNKQIDIKYANTVNELIRSSLAVSMLFGMLGFF